MDRFREPQIQMTERIPLIKQLVKDLTSKEFECQECYSGSKFLRLWYRNKDAAGCTIHIYTFKDDWHNDLPEGIFAIQLEITVNGCTLGNKVPTIIKAKTVKDFLDAFNIHKIMLIEEEMKNQKETMKKLKNIYFI